MPLLPRIPEVEIQGDAIARVEIPLERTVRVRGAVRSRKTGDPVAGVQIFIGHGAPKGGQTVPSDPRGRFEVSTLPGDVTMQVISTDGSWIQFGDDPLARPHRVTARVESFDVPPIEVVRGVTVQGRLVDAGNQPIAQRFDLCRRGDRETPVRWDDDQRGRRVHSDNPKRSSAQVPI